MTRAANTQRWHTTVVIADDHPLYRAALADAVRAAPSLDLVELARDGNEALAAVRRHVPDVALLDMRMPQLDGQAVARRMRELELSTRVLFISEYHDG